MGKPKYKSSRKENLDKYAERQRRMSRSGFYLGEIAHAHEDASTAPFGATQPLTAVGVADQHSPLMEDVLGITSNIVVGEGPTVVRLSAPRHPKQKPPQMTFRELVEEINRRHPFDQAA